MIDAPLNSKPPNADLLLITHPHCDHFIGAQNYIFQKAASVPAKDYINSKKDEICLCKWIGWEFPKITIDLGLKDGEVLEKEGITLEVIYTPGHCEGAVCYYNKKNKLLFSGDTVFPEYGLPRTDFPTSDIGKLIDSYEKLELLEIETIYPGHGPIIKERAYISKVKQLLL